jgi:glycerophosphoryl diester phosphodiesterase
VRRGGPAERMGQLLPLAWARARRAGAGGHDESDRAWGRRAFGAKPLVLAHRGASAGALENTIDAFRLARRQGAEGVELDAMPCGSGEIVVFHDDDLHRLTGGRTERIAHMSLAQLREIGLTGKAGKGAIPLLSEVLEELGPDLLVNIELKTPDSLRAPEWTGQRLATDVADLLRRHGTGRRALVSSFNPLALARFRLAAPFAPTGLLFASDQNLLLRHGWARMALRPLALHPDHRLVTGNALARWRIEGYSVNVWTVDDEAEIARLCALGVDGLITNDPARTRSLLR